MRPDLRGVAHRDAAQAAGRRRASLFPEEAISYPVAAGLAPSRTAAPSSIRSGRCRARSTSGGLVLPITEQLTYARFHLGDGTAADGTRLLSPRRSPRCAHRAPAWPSRARGTREIYGVGVGWLLERIGDVQLVTHLGTRSVRRRRSCSSPSAASPWPSSQTPTRRAASSTTTSRPGRCRLPRSEHAAGDRGPAGGAAGLLPRRCRAHDHRRRHVEGVSKLWISC